MILQNTHINLNVNYLNFSFFKRPLPVDGKIPHDHQAGGKDLGPIVPQPGAFDQNEHDSQIDKKSDHADRKIFKTLIDEFGAAAVFGKRPILIQQKIVGHGREKRNGRGQIYGQTQNFHTQI